MISVPTAFAQKLVTLNWRDWKWGFDADILGEEEVVNLACMLFEDAKDDSALFNLASVLPDDHTDVAALVKELAERELATESVSPNEKWLYIVLAWIFEHQQNYSDPLEVVESVYSDFDYPDQIETFIRYVPPKDGYDPSTHSRSENIQHIMMNWENFLRIQKDRLEPSSD